MTNLYGKRLLSIILAVAMALALLSPRPVMAADGGFLAPIEPPVADSIAISDRAGLEAMAGNLTGKFHLTADIDLSGSEWTSIGTNVNPFSGVFDGQGHVITGMNIHNVTQKHTDLLSPYMDNIFIGLFGYASDAAVKNLGMENTDISIVYPNNGGTNSERLLAGAKMESMFHGTILMRKIWRSIGI